MRIGEAARLAQVNIQTFRYYEREGLLEKPLRRPSGYRDYSMDAVRRIRLVKWLQGLGFSLAEVRQLRSPGPDGRPVASLREKARAKIRQLEAQILMLQSIGETLEAVSACECNGQCPIIRQAIDGDPTVILSKDPGRWSSEELRQSAPLTRRSKKTRGRS
jgi:DNA-binding transcriptional MerR regulator